MDRHREDVVVVEAVERLLGPRRTVTPLGRGTDHAAYAVDDELIARVALDRQAAPTEVEREVALLALVAEVSPLPVPEVVAADADVGLVVLRRLAGTSLLDEPCGDEAVVADQLAALLAALHAVPVPVAAAVVDVDDAPLDEYLAEAQDLLTQVGAVLGPRARLVARRLDEPPPPESGSLLLAHGDLGAEHLLAAPDRVTLTGVIDWSDAAVTDPARDVGRILRDLGPDAARRVVDALPDADLALLPRAVVHARCALVEDIAFGLEAGDPRYSDAALAALDRTFADLG